MKIVRDFQTVVTFGRRARPKYIISACLAGCPCRYDGQSKGDPIFEKLVRYGQAIPVCPEELGGLTTPRVPSGLANGTGEEVWQGLAQVINREGEDLTENFKAGAQEALLVAKNNNITCAILKQHSPSCGLGSTGSATGERIKANGVTAALLLENGFTVISDQDYIKESAENTSGPPKVTQEEVNLWCAKLEQRGVLNFSKKPEDDQIIHNNDNE